MDIRPYAAANEAAVVDLWRRCELTRPWNDPPEHRGRGHGRAGNKDALEFYRRLGYSTDEAVGLGKRLIPDA